MAYVSLYRKYRSQSFSDVIGQDHVVRTIRNAIKAGRIGQGYLFCGSRGTGKTTVARLIAKALNCENGPTPEPCNQCEACLSITNGSAVDINELDAASNRGVDDMDMLRDGVKYPPMRLRYKVYIIDEAHQLSASAKDAFLKTLEEPPPHAVFILATTEAHKIPITIRSRCQQFDFRRGTNNEISERLIHVAKSEGVEISSDAIDLLARSANGSYRDSLSLLEQVIVYTEEKITAKDVYTVLGMVDEDVLLEIGVVLASTDTAAAFSLADTLLREGRDVRELLRSASDHFRDVLALKVGADSRHKNDERWQDQAAQYTQERLVRIIDTFAVAEKELKYNEQHRLGLEMALLKSMIRPKEVAVQSVPEVVVSQPVVARAQQPVVSEPKRVEPKRVSEPVQVTAPAPAAPAVVSEDDPFGIAEPVVQSAPVKKAPKAKSEAPVEPEPVNDNNGSSETVTVTLAELQREWQKILRYLQKVMKQSSAAATAREGRPMELKGSILTLGFDKKHGFHQDRTQENADKVSKAIESVLSAKIKINTVTLEDAPGTTSYGADDRSAPESEAEPVQRSLTDEVLMTFGGTIVEDDKDPWED